MKTSNKLYIDIANKLKNIILTTREYLLPPERELTIVYETTRTTIRRALEVLKQEGLIKAKHGSGYYIIRSMENDLKQLRTMPEKLKLMGIKYKVDIKPIVIIQANKDIATMLNISLYEPVYQIERIFYDQDHVIMVEQGYMPVSLFPVVTKEDLLVRLEFIKKCGFNIDGAHQKISAINANNFLSQSFKIKKGTALLSSILQVYDVNKVPLTYDTQYYYPNYVMTTDVVYS